MKLTLASKEYEERVLAIAREWAKHEEFGIHATETIASQIVAEYIANQAGFTLFEDKADYGG